MSRLVRLFPKDWRRRYGDEVADLLASSNRPWRDRADVLAAAIATRAERIAMRHLRVAAAVLIGLGILGGLWATPRLSDGVREIPGHWWSTLAVLPAVIGVGLVVITWIGGNPRPRQRS